jgi:hypothetical protein
MTDQKQVETVEYFIHLGSTITNDAKCMLEIKSSIAMAKKRSTRRIIFVSKLGVNLMKKLVKCCISSIILCGADTSALRKLERKYLGNFSMWC